MSSAIKGFRGKSVDVPFAVGSILGTRSFLINTEGKLTGVSAFHFTYDEGENVATCSSRTAGSDSFIRGHKAGSNHSMADCEHGFWAYYDEKDYFSSDRTVSGVIEGYGEVIVGKNGFRASKARLRALAAPSKKIYAHSFPLLQLAMVLILSTTAIAQREEFIESITNGRYFLSVAAFLVLVPGVIIMFGTAVLATMMFFLERYALWKFRKSNTPSNWWQKWLFNKISSVVKLQAKLDSFELVKQNYPNVPVFSTRKEMLKAFPDLKKQRKKWKKA